MGGGRMGFHLGNDAYEAKSATPIDAASFVGLFLSRSAIKATGFPDGRLFIYGDDVLYTLAMRRAGQGVIFVPSIRFEHDFKTFEAASRAFRPDPACDDIAPKRGNINSRKLCNAIPLLGAR